MPKPSVTEVWAAIAASKGVDRYTELFRGLGFGVGGSGATLVPWEHLTIAIVDSAPDDATMDSIIGTIAEQMAAEGISYFTAGDKATEEAAAKLGDREPLTPGTDSDDTPIFETAPENIQDFLGALAEERFWTFASIDPEARRATFLDTQDKERVITWDENGSFAGFAEGTSLDLEGAARVNLLNLQSRQLQVLLDPELIAINGIENFDGRAFIKGTGTIVDLRVGGQFAKVDGVANVFYDPVTGTFIDRQGDTLAENKFEWEKLQDEEANRLASLSAEQSGQFAAGDLQVGLAGILDDRSVESIQQPRLGQTAGATAAGELLRALDRRGEITAIANANPGRFVEAEFLKRGLQAPEAQEVPLFGDTRLLEGIIQQLINTQAPAFDQGVVSGLQGTIGDLKTGAETAIQSEIPTPEPAQETTTEPADNRQAFFKQLFELQGAPPIAIRSAEQGIVEQFGQTGLREFQKRLEEGDIFEPLSFAHGGSTTAPAYIAGDAQVGDKANPELIIQNPDGSDTVIPLNKLEGFAEGTGRPPEQGLSIGPVGAPPQSPINSVELYNLGFEHGLQGSFASNAPGIFQGVDQFLGGEDSFVSNKDINAEIAASNFFQPKRGGRTGPATEDEGFALNNYLRGLEAGHKARGDTEPKTKGDIKQLKGFAHGTGEMTALEGVLQGLPHYAEGTTSSLALLEQELRRLGATEAQVAISVNVFSNVSPDILKTQLAHLASLATPASPPVVEPVVDPVVKPVPPPVVKPVVPPVVATVPPPVIRTTVAPQAPPSPTVQVQKDETIQNLPALRFLKGQISDQDFNRLSTTPISGAFGTKLPDSGQLNFNKLQDILKDKQTTELLSSLYTSGSRDFESTVERTKARAPLGRARQTSGIRSG